MISLAHELFMSELNTVTLMLYLPHGVVFIVADYYPVEIYTCELISALVLMRVTIATICPKPLEIPPPVLF